MNNKIENQPNEHTYNAPVAVDPETGHHEVLGEGRILVIGEQGVARIITRPESSDLIDELIADGSLTYSS